MSVVNAFKTGRGTELRDGKDVSTDADVWDVVLENVSDATVARQQALTAPGIPQIGAQHPLDPWKFVSDVTATDRDSIIAWFVTVHYSTHSVDRPRDDDPLTTPTRINFGSVSSVEAIDQDIYGTPITNSAGETFETPITREFHDTLLTITRNQELYNDLQAAEYRGVINSDPFLGHFVAGMCRFNGINASVERTGSLDFYQVTYEIQIRYDGWRRRILDEGYREYLGADDNENPEFKEIVVPARNLSTGTDTGEVQRPASPVNLDGNGRILADAEAAVFLEFDIYRALPFAVWDLKREFV